MYKFVENLDCEFGFGGKQLRMNISHNAEISAHAEKIMEAVDAILDGKSLILSGKEITIHGNVDISKVDSPDIGLAAMTAVSNSTILERENESLRKQLQTLGTRNENLLKENKGIADQRDKLQGILDSLDGVFQSVHVNSTRSTLRRANSRNRHGF